MKLADLSPKVTDWKNGRTLTAESGGAWRTVDLTSDVAGFSERIRQVWHYGTLMGEFVEGDEGSWWLGAMTVGHGSVSDQNGMNTLFQSVGSPVRMKRDGGNPRYVNTENGATLATDGNA